MAIFKKQYTKPLPGNAEIYTCDEQRCARWTDHNGRKRTAKVITGRDGSDRIVLETRTLTVRIREASGVIRQVSSGYRLRSAAESLQANLRNQRERIKSGVITQEENDASHHATTPIADHIKDYLDHLALAASPEHLTNVTRQLECLRVECKIGILADITTDRTERWLAQQIREDMGARTRNTYLAALRSFTAWCIDSGRLLANPLTKVRKADEKADKRHQRRALTEEEIGRLLTIAKLRPVAEYGRTVQKTTPPPELRKRSNWRWTPLTFDTITEASARGREALSNQPHKLDLLDRLGIERALIYKTLLQTGLRLGELASITERQVELDSTPAVIVLRAADEKNREGSIIPLREDLATEIRVFLRGRTCMPFSRNKGPTSKPQRGVLSAPLFNISSGLCGVLNRDLLAAGVSKRDSRNRVVDVHAMRTTFGTYLSKAGVPLRTAQAAMRHSDPKLTANVYTDPVLLDVAGAVNALPSLKATTAPGIIKASKSQEEPHATSIGA